MRQEVISMSKVNGPQRTSLVMLTARLDNGVSGLVAPNLAPPTQIPLSLVFASEPERSKFLPNTTESLAPLPLKINGVQQIAALLIWSFLIGTIGLLAQQPAVEDGNPESALSQFILVAVVKS
jgi:hypothetical protein